MSISSCFRCVAPLLGLALLFSTSALYAASSNHPAGMTGTLTSGSAEVLNEGNIRYFAISGMDDFYDASGNGEREARVLSGATFSISKKLEVGVGLSFAHSASTIASGTELRYLRGEAKYLFHGSRAQGEAAAVSIYSTTGELPGNLGLASGNANTGMEVVYSELGVEGDNSYALGLEQKDYKLYNAGVFEYTGATVVSLSASHLFRTNLNRNYELGFKAESAAIGGVEYGNMYVSLGAHFATEQEMSYLLGAMLDLPGGEGPNRSRYFLGLTYTSKYPRKLGALGSAMEKPREPVKLVLPRKEKPVVVVKESIAPIIKGCLAYVEIMDLSGVSGLSEQVAMKLKKDGYCIRAVYKEESSQAYYSHLYYGLEKGEMAVGLARSYKIQGEVSRRSLPSDVDIRFILGKDQR
ncbi:MAG: LytR C-terminal domain-containing protein [Gammaproteobacteria bacterium]|nr:LytR C-terminal domain-containing protein [Gammaproteobacteria bacterium]